MRALLRTGRVDDAIVELGERIPPFHEHATSAVHQFLLGTAFARSGKYDDAHEAIANAAVYATSSGDRDLITEAAYYRALTAFMCGDLMQAEDIASETLDDRSGSAHARLLELMGLVAGLRGDAERQITMHVAASEHIVSVEHRDAFLEANMLNNLAIPVAEVNPGKLSDYVRARAADIAWNDELQPLRFHVTHRLAWLEALGGNHLAAYRDFRQAVALAPNPARRAEALSGRAYLAHEMGEALGAADSVAEADELVGHVDWDESDDDERYVLLQLATLVAPTDPERGARYVERYKTLPKKIGPMYAVAHGGALFRAKEAHAFGLVAIKSRGPAFAVPLLREAHRLYRSVSSRWRAAVVAMDLYELSGEAELLQFAREHAARVPQSWLARRVARLADATA